MNDPDAPPPNVIEVAPAEAVPCGVPLAVPDELKFAGSVTVNVSRFSLTLTGVDQTYIALALQNNIIHDEVKIFRAFLNSSNSIIADPFLLYHGFINSFQIVDNNNTATIKFDLESYFANAGQVNGRITNDSTQQRFFASDKGFEYSDQIIKDLKWGNQS